MNLRCALLLGLVAGAWVSTLAAARAAEFALRPNAEVGSGGILLRDVLTTGGAEAWADVRVGDSPVVGHPTAVKRDVVAAALRKALPLDSALALTGGPAVQVSRRARDLGELELLQLLTDVLKKDVVADRGELELRLGRPWPATPVPEGPLELRVIELPATGLAPTTLLRFELRAGAESAGTWQVVLQPRIMREIWTARSALHRGQAVIAQDLVRERRDVLTVREPLAEFDHPEAELEAADNLQAGTPILARSLRGRVVLHRGQATEALFEQGAMRISLRVEALEDGAVGELVRLRNPVTRKEFRGKIYDEHNVFVSF